MLPENLIAVASSLEAQFDRLQIPHRQVPMSEWDVLSPPVREWIPNWLVTLLESYRIAGPLLERKHERHNYHRYFRFWEPFTYQERITPNGQAPSFDWVITEEVVGAGFIPLSDETDGDMWVTPITGDASS